MSSIRITNSVIAIVGAAAALLLPAAALAATAIGHASVTIVAVCATTGARVRGIAADVSTAEGCKALIAALPEIDRHAVRAEAERRFSDTTIAAVAIAFAKFLGVFVSGIGSENYLIGPIPLGRKYAISLSTEQLTAIALIVLLTWTNSRGLKLGKLVQNSFTFTKTAALAGLLLHRGLLGHQGFRLHHHRLR